MAKGFGFKSLRTRLVLAISLIILLVCAGLAVGAYFVAAGGLKSAVDVSLTKNADQTAQIIVERLNVHFSGLNALSKTSLFQNFIKNKPELLPFLQKFAAEKGYMDMMVSDLDGNAYLMDGKPTQIADREYFMSAKQGENAVSDPLIRKSNGKLAIFFATPIKNAAGEIIGVLAALGDGNELSNLIADITFGKTGKAFLINTNGTTVAHYDRTLVFKMYNALEQSATDPELKSLAAFEKAMVRGQPGIGEFTLQGVVNHAAYQPVPQTDWILTVGAPKREVFASLDELRHSMLVISLIFLALGLGIGYLIANRISTPIRVATEHLAEVATGNLEREVPTVYLRKQDEIGKLAAVIQSISADLREKTAAARSISQGNLDVKISVKSEADLLSQSMESVVHSLQALISETGFLTQQAVEGSLLTRGDQRKFEGGFQAIVSGINHTLDTLVGHIDSIPLPVFTVDREFTILYINQSGAELFNQLPHQIIGAKCYEQFQTDHCQSSHCACGIAMEQGRKETAATAAHPNGAALDISYTGIPIRNEDGAVIGALEVIVDQTEIKQAVRIGQKQADYQRNEVLKMIANLNRLAAGDLQCRLEVDPTDEDTAALGADFDRINRSLGECIAAIHRMTADVNLLSEAAVAGRLDERADVALHHGEYREIVDGFNRTLDTITAPLNEAGQVLERMSLNDYTVAMVGNYHGLLSDFKEAVNQLQTRLLTIQDVVVRVSRGDTTRLLDLAQVGKRSANDQMLPALITMMRNIQDLIEAVNQITTEAGRGNLKARGQVERYQGGFRELIGGVNATLDTVIAPMNEVAAVLEEMAQGKLDCQVDGAYQGDFAVIKDTLNETLQSFNRLLGEINAAAAQVTAGSRQVSDSSQTLSNGSAEQASAIEELTATLEEIGAQTKQNAVRANQANQLVTEARNHAVAGNDQMQAMVDSMREIDKASLNISRIIKVIDEIAFQTNILALNAAVEAARAGQHGKGFAVVAEEVRNLAARSANAAKETATLIEGTVQTVSLGTKNANQTAEALSRIVAGVETAAALVGEIAAASNEQATGIAQVNMGITQVSQVTQSNSATSEQSAAASQELFSQAELLRSMVGQFQLKGETSGILTLEQKR